jgi:hypothetical protein
MWVWGLFQNCFMHSKAFLEGFAARHGTPSTLSVTPKQFPVTDTDALLEAVNIELSDESCVSIDTATATNKALLLVSQAPASADVNLHLVYLQGLNPLLQVP